MPFVFSIFGKKTQMPSFFDRIKVGHFWRGGHLPGNKYLADLPA
jgi:hypothetical protein